MGRTGNGPAVQISCLIDCSLIFFFCILHWLIGVPPDSLWRLLGEALQKPHHQFAPVLSHEVEAQETDLWVGPFYGNRPLASAHPILMLLLQAHSVLPVNNSTGYLWLLHIPQDPSYTPSLMVDSSYKPQVMWAAAVLWILEYENWKGSQMSFSTNPCSVQASLYLFCLNWYGIFNWIPWNLCFISGVENREPQCINCIERN